MLSLGFCLGSSDEKLWCKFPLWHQALDWMNEWMNDFSVNGVYQEFFQSITMEKALEWGGEGKFEKEWGIFIDFFKNFQNQLISSNQTLFWKIPII